MIFKVTNLSNFWLEIRETTLKWFKTSDGEFNAVFRKQHNIKNQLLQSTIQDMAQCFIVSERAVRDQNL